MSQDKLPSFQFYPGDWLKDPAVRAVSLAARGLWIDMLCLMHESPRRGYLQHATGKPVTAEQLARMTGCSTDEVSRLLRELENAGVFTCAEHGVIYSRRMVRDEYIRQVRREAGKKGGNPTLLNQKSNQKSTTRVKQKSNQNPTPSSSSSFSSSSSTSSSTGDLLSTGDSTPVEDGKIQRSPPLKSPPQKRGGEIDWGAVVFPPGCDTPDVRAAIEEWLDYRHQTGKPYRVPEKQITLLLARYGNSIIEAVRNSIANGYQGCYPPAAGGKADDRRYAAGPGQRHPADASTASRGW